MRTLSEEEQGISTKRREVQNVMDACSAEITRRYRDGEADVATLLAEQPARRVSLPVLVELVRSGVVESTHTGSVVALRADGSTALSLGDVDRPVFPRSSNKPLQAVGLLEAGWSAARRRVPRARDRLPLRPAGAPRGRTPHAGRGRPDRGRPRLPRRCSRSTSRRAHALLRGGGEATRLTMNCSGKHAAMLATCVANGWPTGDYLAAGPPGAAGDDARPSSSWPASGCSTSPSTAAARRSTR